MSFKPAILLLYTGGTIGMVKNADTGALKVLNFDKLLKNIPELKLLDCSITAMSFDEPIDSSDVTPKEWVAIAEIIKENYDSYNGFVILHGSDTMSYTASALSFMLKNLSKPVILTGSQLPIGDLRTDAKENLITAIQVASLYENTKPVIQEVGLYFEYKLYRGNRTTKISAEHFNAFTSPNYPPLAESGVNLRINKPALLPRLHTGTLQLAEHFNTNVAIIKIFPGINRQIIKCILNTSGLKGVVLETYGAGNAPTDGEFLLLLQQAIQNGIYIINVTQCSGGSVTMGQYETSTQLKQIGVLSGKDITTEAAITKLMHLLGQDMAEEDLKAAIEIALCGEMD